ncbi:MAG: sulfatase [Pirellulaceae bacterium]|nr:MAG: sulfatase [Pirellulaceae bacterium]
MKCAGNSLSRRGFVTVGAVGGLTLADFLRLRSVYGDQKSYDFIPAKAESVIHVFLPGGMAQQESFDPKPYSPLEYRGEMGVTRTNTGEVISQTLPQLAKCADKFTIIRSLTHGEAAHERGTHNMFTGYKPSPALVYPSFGSVVSHEYGSRNNLPPYICIPNKPNEYAGSGYLSSSYGPFSLGSDPASNGFRVQDLNLPNGVDEGRFARRRAALQAVNEYFAQRQRADAVTAMDSFYERAYGLISSQQAREAFDIDKEPDALRDKYGRNQAGQRMLLARRLVEAGARFVTLTYGGWDMHNNITDGFRNQMPALDQALATLLQDLDSRGLLQSTLVMVSSEFGRTPKINSTAGRDHWPKVFSVLLAGGGVKGGYIHGASDATASEPDLDPVSPEDLATTMYHLLGIVADKELMAPGDRPIEIVDGGKVVKQILA